MRPVTYLNTSFLQDRLTAQERMDQFEHEAFNEQEHALGLFPALVVLALLWTCVAIVVFA
jgi:hypothetical protein